MLPAACQRDELIGCMYSTACWLSSASFGANHTFVRGKFVAFYCSASYVSGIQLCCRLPLPVTLFSIAWSDTQAVPYIWFCHKGVQSGTWVLQGKQAARPNDERRGSGASSPPAFNKTHTHLCVAALWQWEGPGVSTQLSLKCVYRAMDTVYRSTWRLQSHSWWRMLFIKQNWIWVEELEYKTWAASKSHSLHSHPTFKM